MHVLSANKRGSSSCGSQLAAYLFSALKIASSTAVIGAIVGEWIGTNVGIGALIVQATYAFDSALLYATVIVGSAFSVTFFLVITLAERLVIKWQPNMAL
jgi:NitT/TauT family transport system permease protein